jgi:Outer membrane protein beta-barrel domain
MTRSNWQIVSPAAMLVMAAAGAAPAAAQPHSQARFEISANVGAQTGAGKFTQSEALPSNGGENATLTLDHGVKTAPGFNAGAAVRILPRFWVGVQYAMANMKPTASIDAAIPHPIQFNTPRTVQGSIDDLAHDEQNIHVDLMYALPFQALDVKVMGGPTFFNVKQDFVSGLAVNETYPFDTATFASATTKQLSDSAVGFNAGVDVSRALTSHLGVGGLVRYSRADVKFDDADVGKHTVKAGGLEATAGVRVRF